MSTELKKAIANRLRAARKAAGYKTSSEAASSFNLPISTYSQYELAKRSINLEILLQFSQKLQINPFWLFTGKGDPYAKYDDGMPETILDKDIALQKNEDNKNYQYIDLFLLKKILFIIEDVVFDKSVGLSYQELIEYCFEVYNIVAHLTAPLAEKEKIINLTISSIKRVKEKNRKNINRKIS